MVRVFLLAVVALSITAPAAAARAADKPRVGYLGADAAELSAEAAAAVDSGAVAGLQSMATVETTPILPTDVTRMKSGRLCASQDCARAVGGRTGAAYLVRAEANRTNQTDYAITLDLIRVEPFGVLFTGEDRCPACIPAKLGRRVELSVAALVTQLVESLEAKPVISESANAGASAGGQPKDSSPGTPGPEPAEPSARRWAWVPWTAGGLAVGSFVGAVIAWRADGDGTCSLGTSERQCPRVYQTKPAAIALGVVGLISATGAVWSFYKLRASSHEIAFGITGTGLLVTGRF